MINNITETYGELLPESVSKLINAVSITEDDVFLDLGSGLGKVVSQLFLQTKVKESRGIEINPQLHAQAQILNEQIVKEDHNTRKITLSQGDFRECSSNCVSIKLSQL